MGLLDYGPSLFSTFFRINAYVFLRVAPHRMGVAILPSLFVLYISSLFFTGDSKPAVKRKLIKQEDKKSFAAGLNAEEQKLLAESAAAQNGAVTTTTTQTVVEETDSSCHYPFLTLLWTLPTKSRSIRAANLIINTLLLAFAADLLLNPFWDPASEVVFARVGAVYHDAAKIVVRYPPGNPLAPKTISDIMTNVHANDTEAEPTPLNVTAPLTAEEQPDHHKVRVMWRQFSSSSSDSYVSSWKSGPVIALDKNNDWVGSAKLSGLWPRTEYEYHLADVYSSSALLYPSASSPTKSQDHSINPLRFRTFPDPHLSHLSGGDHYRFIVSSCMTTNFPYRPLGGTRVPGFDMLADWLGFHDGPASKPVEDAWGEASSVISEAFTAVQEGSTLAVEGVSSVLSSAAASSTPLAASSEAPADAEPSTDFMLFLGDFIYADVPVYAGGNTEAFRKLYRRNYKSNSVRRVYERLPIFHTYDDHEFINNFAGLGAEAEPFPNASDAYTIYNGQGNYDSAPSAPLEQGIPPTGHKENYYDFRHGDSAFFVLDTRRYRSEVPKLKANGQVVRPKHHESSHSDFADDSDSDAEYEETADDPSRTMLGPAQLASFLTWLSHVNSTATFKFVVSSVPLTSLWTYEGQIDTWAAYRREKDIVLSALESVKNVVVLTGDRHEFAVIEYLREGGIDNTSEGEGEATNIGNTLVEVSTSPMSMFYVPFIRTLKMASEETVKRLVRKEVVREVPYEVDVVVPVSPESEPLVDLEGAPIPEGQAAFILEKKTEVKQVTEVEVTEEDVPRERVLKYLPLGNHKWSAFTVDTRDPKKPKLKLEVHIDGHKAHEMEMIGAPVPISRSRALGDYVKGGFKSIMDQFIKPGRWF